MDDIRDMTAATLARAERQLADARAAVRESDGDATMIQEWIDKAEPDVNALRALVARDSRRT
jgi:hypothetical protein